jgi:hypothetical protein
LVNFIAVWYILWSFGIFKAVWGILWLFGRFYGHFGMLCQEKSGNPVLRHVSDELFMNASVTG